MFLVVAVVHNIIFNVLTIEAGYGTFKNEKLMLVFNAKILKNI